jgi:hypothetical protein
MHLCHGIFFVDGWGGGACVRVCEERVRAYTPYKTHILFVDVLGRGACTRVSMSWYLRGWHGRACVYILARACVYMHTWTRMRTYAILFVNDILRGWMGWRSVYARTRGMV